MKVIGMILGFAAGYIIGDQELMNILAVAFAAIGGLLVGHSK